MPRIALFFTLGNSLEVWNQYGMLEREVALYRRLAEHGVETTFITYGRRERGYIQGEWKPTVCFNEFGLPGRLYEVLVPILHWKQLRRCRVFKTNQANGGQVALRAASLMRRPLIARCGYMWSSFTAERYGENSREAVAARAIEDSVFSGSERVVVTTEEMRKQITARLPGTGGRIRVIPNYVDTALFTPDPNVERKNQVLFIGRLSPQKNVRTLLEAVAPLKVSVAIVGDGEQRHTLMEEFGSLDGRIEWHKSVPHERLPSLINSASVFVLPSLYEGQPKVLLEAMACGTPVLGANSPGIRELIDDGRNGLVCEPTVDGIRRAVGGLLGQPELREKLGRRGRAFIERHFSLDSVVKQELDLIESLS